MYAAPLSNEYRIIRFGFMNTSIRINLSTKLSLCLAMAISPIIMTCHFALNAVASESGLVAAADARQLLIVCTVVSLFSIVATFTIFLFPLCKRIRQLANAADCASNDTQFMPIKDSHNDELGGLARLLNQLAQSSLDINKKHEIDKLSLSHQATHDELTGLSNRKHGNETILKLDSRTDECPISILFLDLDGFKAVNDTCGHAVGDEILVAVSLRLKAILQQDTILIRWGGDEFVIVVPDADQRRAISVAQDVAGLFRQPISTSQGIHKLGCSIGLATSRPNTSLDDILQEADANMYENKKKRKSLRGSSVERAVDIVEDCSTTSDATVARHSADLDKHSDAANDDVILPGVNKAA